MKILFYGLNYFPEPVGIGKYSGELCEWFDIGHHDVRVITAPPYFPEWHISSGSNSFSSDFHHGIRVRRCPLWVPSSPSGITRLIHLASFAISSFIPLLLQRFWKPDVVITVAPAFFCAPGALFLSGLCGSNCISWLHIQDFELDAAFELGLLNGKLLRKFAEIWERRTLCRFDRVSSISTAMVQRLLVKGVAPSCSLLLPNWVDLDEIYPIQFGTSSSKNPYRQKLGISNDHLVLMYSGSMNKKQGLTLLVEAIYLLSDVPNLIWLFAGEGPTKGEFMQATQGYSNVVHLPLQPAESMNNWLNAADIHLLPQMQGVADLVLPSKLLGMLASGRAVVACSTPGSELEELVSEAGACTTPGDAEAFAEALRYLIVNREQRIVAGHNARRLARERFGKQSVLNRFEQQLYELVESRRLK